MRYLKLFEDLEDDEEELYYEEITSREYYDIIHEVRSIQPQEKHKSLLVSFTKKEKEKIKSYLQPKYDNRMKIGSTGITITGFNHEVVFSKLEDEWFLVSFDGKGIDVKYKCDQWHGFKQCLEYMKKNDWADIFVK